MTLALLIANAVIILVLLKLAGVISWSWVWVLAPSWLPAIALAALLFFDVFKGHVSPWRKKS